MLVTGAGDSANGSEGQGSQPGAAGGWRDTYRVLSLPPRRLPATFAPSIILGLNGRIGFWGTPIGSKATEH